MQVIPYGEDQNLLVSRDVSQIERIETMRRDFIANVSHELKTPLTAVAGFSEMLADGFEAYDNAEIRHYLSLICEQNARMQRLIQDLLTLSALESRSPSSEERVELAPMLNSILADVQVLSAGKHEISLAIEAPSVLGGSATELRSAFGNLAGNAVRYTPAGGRIELIWRRIEGAGGEFIVADTGIGIPAQHLPRLTERFYRVDRSRSRETGGTGLSLAIVKHVLTRHHAALIVESEPGKGSRFTARFPERVLLA